MSKKFSIPYGDILSIKQLANNIFCAAQTADKSHLRPQKLFK